MVSRSIRVWLLALAATLVGAVAASAPDAGAVPSATLSYLSIPDPAVDRYARPGNVIIVTMEQRVLNPRRILAWRRKGAIVLAYVGGVARPDASQGPLQSRLYGYGGKFPAGWFYPGNLVTWPGTRLLDVRRSSPVASYDGFKGRWGDYLVDFIDRRVIGDGRLFNGVFLDVWGDRIWNLGLGGRGSSWDRGITRWTRKLRQRVGDDVYLVANNTVSPETARSLNGRMYESFESRQSGWNALTGGGENPGVIKAMEWDWHAPRLMILWRNEASPDTDTKRMLVSGARAATRTGRDVVVGSSDHRYGIPAPFGGR